MKEKREKEREERETERKRERERERKSKKFFSVEPPTTITGGAMALAPTMIQPSGITDLKVE